MGMTQVRDKFQLNEIDGYLRTALWNYIDNKILHHGAGGRDHYYITTSDDVISKISTEYFHNRYVEINYKNANSYINSYYKYCMETQWFQVYDFVEFSVNCLSDFSGYGKNMSEQAKARSDINLLLEKHMSGYRYVNGILSPITDNC